MCCPRFRENPDAGVALFVPAGGDVLRTIEIGGQVAPRGPAGLFVLNATPMEPREVTGQWSALSYRVCPPVQHRGAFIRRNPVARMIAIEVHEHIAMLIKPRRHLQPLDI